MMRATGAKLRMLASLAALEVGLLAPLDMDDCGDDDDMPQFSQHRRLD